MSDEKEPGNESAQAAPNTSENVEVPKANGTWQMPEPVFQQSSGYLPQGFEKRWQVDPQADISTEEPVSDDPPAQPSEGETADISSVPDDEMVNAEPSPALMAEDFSDVEPQPHLTEDFAAPIAAAPVSQKKKRSVVARVILGLLAIIAMIAVGFIFLALIWYLFFYHPGDAPIFN